jgi:hypothetical protein
VKEDGAFARAIASSASMAKKKVVKKGQVVCYCYLLFCFFSFNEKK